MRSTSIAAKGDLLLFDGIMNKNIYYACILLPQKLNSYLK